MSEPTSIVVRLTAAIWGALLLVGGVVLLILPLVLSGDQAGLAVGGAAMVALGLAAGLTAWMLHSRVIRKRLRRTERVQAAVVDARLHTMTRIGAMLTYTVTVRFAPLARAEAEYTRKLLVPPTHPLEAGKRIEVLYDPRDPGNFAPVLP
jgi:Protein of unknown function (DUF3592)